MDDIEIAPNVAKIRGGRHGRVELVALCRRMAIEEGDTLDHMLWRVIRSMVDWAEKGDHHCAKLLFSFLARHIEDGAPQPDTVPIGGFVANSIVVNLAAGPPVPQDVSAYVAEVERVALELPESSGVDDALARLLA